MAPINWSPSHSLFFKFSTFLSALAGPTYRAVKAGSTRPPHPASFTGRQGASPRRRQDAAGTKNSVIVQLDKGLVFSCRAMGGENCPDVPDDVPDVPDRSRATVIRTPQATTQFASLKEDILCGNRCGSFVPLISYVAPKECNHSSTAGSTRRVGLSRLLISALKTYAQLCKLETAKEFGPFLLQ